MSWYQLVTGSPSKIHYFNHQDEYIMQNTSFATCGSVGFGQDLEKISEPSPSDMCSRCYKKLAKYNETFEGKY
jgi:hypothetical protein